MREGGLGREREDIIFIFCLKRKFTSERLVITGLALVITSPAESPVILSSLKEYLASEEVYLVLILSLYFRKLKGLKLSGLPNVRDMGLMVLLLEEALPECTIFGVDPEMLKPPSDDPHSQLSSRMHAITEGQNADSKESNLLPHSIDHDSVAHGNTKL